VENNKKSNNQAKIASPTYFAWAKLTFGSATLGKFIGEILCAKKILFFLYVTRNIKKSFYSFFHILKMFVSFFFH